MTLLHTQFESGNILTAGSDGGVAGVSGLSDINSRINFANYDFAMNGSYAFTYTAGRMTKVVFSGADQIHETNIVYDGGLIGSVVTSGATIGSIITTELFGTGGLFVSGITKLE